MIINSYTEFQPLEEIVVGRAYPGEYFDYINDPEIRNYMIRLFDETEEDFLNLIQLLQSFGVTVTRPEIVSKAEFQNQAVQGHFSYPPITPRDHAITLGNTLFKNSATTMYNSVMDYYQQLGGTVIDPYNRRWDSDHVMSNSSASCILRLGRDIFFDQSDWLTHQQSQWVQENILQGRDHRIHFMDTDGHSDAVFCIPKPGIILTTHHDKNLDYNRDFPGWQVYRIQPVRNTIIQERVEQGIEWWAPGRDDSDKFKNYVETYLNNWLGSIHETVFDVNVLVVDESNVIFSHYNRDLFAFCEKQGINCHVSELRHRYFWDGGIHCCTLDIRRTGGMESYL
jgi:glycine amidinotransferase